MARVVPRAGWRQRRHGATLVAQYLQGQARGGSRWGKLYLELKLLFSASRTLPTLAVAIFLSFFLPLACYSPIPSVLERKLSSLLRPG